MSKAKDEKEPLRCKNMMYTQQLKYLKGDIDALEKRIQNMRSPPVRYALILHDKDIGEEDHVQVMLCFKNARYVTAVAKALGDNPQQIKVWDDRADNGFAYLIHDTRNRKDAHHYDPEEVRANFDYKALIKKIRVEVEQKESASNNIRDMLDMLLLGIMTKEQVLSKLSGSQYAKWHKQIEDVHAQFLKNSAEEWRKNFISSGKQVVAIWVYGKYGTGKTDFARQIAEKHGEYFKSGSSRDIFQFYQGQNVIILDELRPNSIQYDDLLKILDPFSVYSGVPTAPSRYHDKALAADTYIITTPYDPLTFYNSSVMGSEVQKIDKVGQLLRRLTLIIEMDDDYIYPVEFDEPISPGKKNTPHRIPGASRPNPYSQKKRPASKPDPKNVFDGLFDQGTDKTEDDKTPT